MAENILAAACESETRNAAKRMRLDIYQAHVSAYQLICRSLIRLNSFFGYLVSNLLVFLFLPYTPVQEESVTADKPNSRDPAALANSGFSLAASAYSQDQLYTNGGLNYSFRGYGTLGNNIQNNGTSQTNGE